MDQRLSELMKELGHAIDECLSNSTPISEVSKKILTEGYDVFLVVEVTAGFTPMAQTQTEDEEDEAGEVIAGSLDADFPRDPRDIQFLKALHISAG